MNASDGGEVQIVEIYRSLRLHCNQEQFAHLRKLIYAESGISNRIKMPDDRVQWVTITSVPVADPPPFRWITLVPCMIASCVSILITVVGVVTIARWILERVA